MLSPTNLLDVESLNGIRRVLVDEGNLLGECSPKMLQKDIQTKNNLIVALCPCVIGELMVREAKTPPKKSQTSNPEQKKYQKRQKPDENELEMLEFAEEEDEE